MHPRRFRPPVRRRLGARTLLPGLMVAFALVWFVAIVLPALARASEAAGDARLLPRGPDPDLGLTAEQVRALFPERFGSADGRVRPLAIPDVFGHGSVLDVGKLVMKVTNNGYLANPFPALSSDPSCQWPSSSGVEYMNFCGLGVGAVNPQATDPNAIRRVSYFNEFRPATLEPRDRMYPAYDGIVNGTRFGNDDTDFDEFGEPRIDEDFLDGHDNDGDARVDEDYAAIGQKMFSWVMRDDTPEAINFAQAEKHVPLGIEVRQIAWAYSLSQFENFNVIDTQVRNVSGHELDSLVIGFLTDFDAGSFAVNPTYYNDDFDVPGYPQGEFHFRLPETDSRRQQNHSPTLFATYPQGTPLCDQLTIRINGCSLADDDGDELRTPGVPSMLLFDMTTDPLGRNAPSRVGWRVYRSYPRGTPYTQRGGPAIDQQRFELLTSNEGINVEGDPSTNPDYGFINAEPGDQKGDYRAWTGVGPYLHVADGASVHVTIGIAVQRGSYRSAIGYSSDYRRYRAGLMTQEALFEQYPGVANAFTAQLAFEGIYERRSGVRTTTFHGRESEVCTPLTGQTQFVADCHDGDNLRSVSPGTCAWFDFDCDYCSGVYDNAAGIGLFHKTWNASAPPPNPNTNVATSYNFSDNPARGIAPAADGSITIAWDNLSEYSPDPGNKHEFDFRGYKVWKVSNWTRPVGSPGPADDQWALLATFRQFNHRNIRNQQLIPNNRYWRKIPGTPDSEQVCPRVYIPQRNDSVDICLEFGDLWDRQSGIVLRPDTSVRCIGWPVCAEEAACAVGIGGEANCLVERRAKYPIGRYRYTDREVKNGFMYFYAVTAFDSTQSESGITTELEGRRSAVEAEGVVPQISTRKRGAWVVPNPYKGFGDLGRRPSTWDLTPNASDPTGTHIDFMGLPPDRWTIRIYTVAGDLVSELHSSDPVNESTRSTVTLPSGQSAPGYNRQQDTPNDGQARWNLITRNGQDIVSGIYLFTVEAANGEIQRGRFVVIR